MLDKELCEMFCVDKFSEYLTNRLEEIESVFNILKEVPIALVNEYLIYKETRDNYCSYLYERNKNKFERNRKLSLEEIIFRYELEKEVKEKHFYIAKFRSWKYFEGKHEEVTAVVQCTRVDKYDHAAYNVAHFKTCRGEYIAQFDAKWGLDTHVDGDLKIIKEVLDDKLKDTTIEFIDDKHYKKRVNRNQYKEYEIEG